MKKRRPGGPHVADIAEDIEERITVGTFYDPRDLSAKVSDFEGALRIDENALEEALQQQPDLIYRVSKIVSLQTSRRDAAKAFLANQEALARANIQRAAKDKLTVDDLKAQVQVSAMVVKATDQLMQMNHSVRQWSDLKDALIQRSHAIRELVTLYVHSYFDNSSDNQDVREMRKHSSRQARQLAREGIYERRA